MDIIMDLKVAIVLSVAFMITGLKLYTLRSFDTITKKKNSIKTLLRRERTRQSVLFKDRERGLKRVFLLAGRIDCSSMWTHPQSYFALT